MLDIERDPEGVLSRAVTREPFARGWHDLHSFNAPGTRDARVAIQVYARLGLHPIVLQGVAADGSCTCNRPDCAAAGKHPIGAGWQRGEIDIDTADRLLASNWRLGLGLRMGAQPGGFRLVALDIDGDLSLLDPLVAQYGPLPPTLTQRTARGWHLIFKVRDDVTLRNRVRLAPGVDVRAEGGQIVASPTRHRSGAFYTWTQIMEPAVLP